jgi:hypothetical protein
MRGRGSLLLFFFFLFLVEVVLFVVLLLGFFFLALLVFFLIEIVGDGVQMYGMGLRDFQFGFTFRAAQNLTLLHFVFVDVNFGATIGAANHGTILRTEIHGGGRGTSGNGRHPSYYIPHAEKSNCS